MVTFKILLHFTLLFLVTVSVDTNRGKAPTGKKSPSAGKKSPAKVPRPAPSGGIQCYQCHSMKEPDCALPGPQLPEAYVKACPLKELPNMSQTKSIPAIGCWSIVQKIPKQAPDLAKRVMTIRQCAYWGQDKDCISTNFSPSKSTYCFCNTTKCNGSNSVRPNSLFALLSIVVVLFFAKFVD